MALHHEAVQLALDIVIIVVMGNWGDFGGVRVVQQGRRVHLYGGASHGGGSFLATACGHTGRDLSHRGEPLVPSLGGQWRMTLRLRYLLVVVSVFTLASQGLAQGCAEWNTQEFFESATPYEVRACLEAWSRVNARTLNDTLPLHFAAWYTPNPAVIAVLLEVGAEVNARNEFGNTPLHIAAWTGGDINNIRVIHEAGARGSFAVISALRVLLLLEAGAEVNALNKDGDTPLHTAAGDNNNPAVITALVVAGAEVNALNKDGRTPLHYAALHSIWPYVIEALLNAGAAASARDHEGKTPWDYAQDNEGLSCCHRGTDAWWRLREGSLE